MARRWFIMPFVVSGVVAALIVSTAGPSLAGGWCTSSYTTCTDRCNGANKCVHNCIDSYLWCDAQPGSGGSNLGPPKNQPTSHLQQKARVGWFPVRPFGK
jgi:hypothetical protein